MLALNRESDPMASLESVRTLITVLRQNDATAEQVLRGVGHSIAETDLAAAKEWLGRQLEA